MAQMYVRYHMYFSGSNIYRGHSPDVLSLVLTDIAVLFRENLFRENLTRFIT